MSRLSRRQTRHRTFGWRPELYSPPRHNESVRIRKKLHRMHRTFLDVRRGARQTATAFQALGDAAKLASARFDGLTVAQARIEDAFARQKAIDS